MYLLRIHRFRINTTYNNKVNLVLKTTCINQNLFKRTCIFSCHYSVFYVIWTFIKRPPVLKDHLSLSIEWSLMLRYISLFFFYQYIMMVSIIGGRNQSMWKKPVYVEETSLCGRNQSMWKKPVYVEETSLCGRNQSMW
jgi:hypothetical protein